MTPKPILYALGLACAALGSPLNRVPAPPLPPPSDVFCGGNGAVWNSDTWSLNGEKEFVFDRCNYYSGAGGEWPTDEGIPRAFAQYGDRRDNLWNWPTECRSVTDTCSISDSYIVSVETCTEEWRRGLALWAMRNAARYLQLYYDAVTDAFDTGALRTAEIIEIFTDNEPSFKMNPMAWIIFASGAIGAATAAVPVVGAVAGHISGFLGMAIGVLNGQVNAARDPRFTDFADFQGRLGEAKQSIQAGLEATFNRLFKDTPPAGDRAAGTELSGILSSGFWAAQDSAELIPDSRAVLVRALHAGLITEAWNSREHYLITWGNGLMSDIKGHQLEPCTAEIEHIENLTLCIEGRNFAFVRNAPKSQSFWSDDGFTEADLNSFGITREQVVMSSVWRQNLSGRWVDRTYDGTQKFMESMIRDRGGDRDSLIQFNLAVCNLDDAEELLTDQGSCVTEIGCLGAIAVKTCSRMALNGVKFPYQQTKF